MFTQNEEMIALVASGDLSGCLNRVVDLLGANFKVGIAVAKGGYGVLANAPKDTEHASVVVGGTTMVRVGAAVTAGNELTSAASGWAIAVTAQDSNRVIGRALTTAASGMVAAVRLGQYYRANSVGN